MLQKEVILSIGGHDYTITFPTVGQFYSIEAMKQRLSGGMYNTMVLSPADSAQHALDMIDIEATLVILCPKLIEDLKVKNFSELDIRDYTEIRDKYYEVVAPFFREVQSVLKGDEKEKVSDEKA